MLEIVEALRGYYLGFVALSVLVSIVAALIGIAVVELCYRLWSGEREREEMREMQAMPDLQDGTWFCPVCGGRLRWRFSQPATIVRYCGCGYTVEIERAYDQPDMVPKRGRPVKGNSTP